MLRVLFGKDIEGTIPSPSVYFDNVYEYECLDDPVVIQMVKDIDQSELKGLCVLSPFLGSIPVERLSGGGALFLSRLY